MTRSVIDTDLVTLIKRQVTEVIGFLELLGAGGLQSASADQPHLHCWRRTAWWTALWKSQLHYFWSDQLLPGSEHPHRRTRKWLQKHWWAWRRPHSRYSTLQECLPKFLFLLQGRSEFARRGIRLRHWQQLRSRLLPMMRESPYKQHEQPPWATCGHGVSQKHNN